MTNIDNIKEKINIEETQLKRVFNELKTAYNAAPASTYQDRKSLLMTLKKSLIDNEEMLYSAMNKDYGYRSSFDSMIGDVLPCISTINYTLKNLKKWMQPSKRRSGLMLQPSSIKVHYQPLGVVGVITSWNFPCFLALGPAIQALSAGNRVMIKMSEFTPSTNQVIRKILTPLSDYIVIIEGEPNISAVFSSLPFDHLIFTGSTAVGKLVAKAAAHNLTPTTLELGGKSPTIIDSDINMKIAVDAIILGKSVNSGQICVSPDYVFIPKNREQEFVEIFKLQYAKYYLSGKNKNFQTTIINDKNFNRLKNLLKDAKNKGANIHTIKDYKQEDGRLMYPHIVTNITENMKIMQEEIFGSILPVKPYQSIDEVINYINNRPRPLALYIMSKNNSLIDMLLKNTHSGGVSINDTASHVAAVDAPFGGIGHSGMGHYHAYEGFLTFSKAKTVLYSSSWLPKNSIVLKNRDFLFNVLRKLLLK